MSELNPGKVYFPISVIDDLSQEVKEVNMGVWRQGKLMVSLDAMLGFASEHYAAELPLAPAIAGTQPKPRPKRNSRADGAIEFDCGLSLYPAEKLVTVDDRELPKRISPTGFDVLYMLACKPGVPVKREKIYDHIWGPDSEIEFRIVDTYMRRIRQSLGASVKKAGKLDSPQPNWELFPPLRRMGYMLGRRVLSEEPLVFPDFS